jgi:hypothetical protein
VAVAVEVIAADSGNTSELEGGREPVAQPNGNRNYCLRGKDPGVRTTKRPERLEKRLPGSMRRDGWDPMRTGIKKKNQSLILRVRTYFPPQVIQKCGVKSRGTVIQGKKSKIQKSTYPTFLLDRN